MKDIYKLIPRLIDAPAARTVIELGAHQGEDTLQLRRAFPNALLFSFEPDPRNIRAMRDNGTARFTTLIEAAVGDADGTAELHLSSARLESAPDWVRTADYAGSSSLKRPDALAHTHPWCVLDRAVTVRTLTLDTFMRARGIDHVDFLWADVQGAEDLMLAGGQACLARTAYLYTECSDGNEYQGQIGLSEILQRLPGEWDVVERYPYDALLRNLSLLDGPR